MSDNIILPLDIDIGSNKIKHYIQKDGTDNVIFFAEKWNLPKCFKVLIIRGIGLIKKSNLFLFQIKQSNTFNIPCCIATVFHFPFLPVFPQGIFCCFLNIYQKIFKPPLLLFCVTSFHGLCPHVNRPRQSCRSQMILLAWYLPGGVLGISQCQTHFSCQSRKGIYILGARSLFQSYGQSVKE